ncbi:hypothetical protein CYMTET_8168 [Cymbomonas tetramitiformis]|uniref:Uncharacterized protein n=1 Tax=Cymbomonas tetramitiformis TaxID=36881 RepID=A0AAE0LG95_9CHLO|nr:hypothetical protein CYMTET_8168 [Cymbomonas tetramitiformis]
MDAASAGDASLVSKLIEEGADLSVQCPQTGSTLLHKAACGNHVETIQVLLQAGVDKDSQLKDKKTPLHLAALHVGVEAVKALIAAGADKDALDKDHLSPLFLAVREIRKPIPGVEDVANTLVKLGADINTQDRRGRTPLHFVCHVGCLSLVEEFIAAGANKEAQDQNGNNIQNTPLHYAADAGHVEIVAALLKAGADKEAPNRVGDTILHQAAGNSHHRVVKMLLEAGAEKDSRNRKGETPLHNAIMFGDVDTVKTLMAAGADLEIKGMEGPRKETPLEIAVRNRKPDLVRILLDAGADKAVKGKDGATLIHVCVSRASREAMSMLAEAGLDLNATDDNGLTPVHTAALSGEAAMLPALLAAGAGVSVPDKTGCTPLQLAVTLGKPDEFVERWTMRGGGVHEAGYIAVAKALIDAGADVNAPLSVGALLPVLFLHHHGSGLGGLGAALRLCRWNLLTGSGADRRHRLRPRGAQGKRTLLHCAASKGLEEMTAFLLGAGADKDAQDEEGRTPLMLHLQLYKTVIDAGMLTFMLPSKGWPALQKGLLDAGGDLDLVDKEKKSALHIALATANMKAAKELIAKGAAKDLTDADGKTPLYYALVEGDKDLVEALMAGGGEAGAKTPLQKACAVKDMETAKAILLGEANDGDFQYTALHRAAAGGDCGAVQTLLAEDATEKEAKSKAGNTPLLVALAAGHGDIAKVLIEAGADKDAVNNAKMTPLQHAAHLGLLEVVKTLVEAGANINLADSNKGTALKHAARQGHAEIVETLLTGDSEGRVENELEEALLSAAWGDHSKVCSALITAGANTAHADWSGRSALHIAAGGGFHRTVEALLAGKADMKAVTARTKDTALHCCAEGMRDRDMEGHTVTAEMLLKAGVPVDETNGEGDTPLHSASRSGCVRMVKVLLQAGANMGLLGGLGEYRSPKKTPLQYAVYEQHVEVVKVLLEAGADVALLDDQGNIALHVAVGSKNKELFDMLLAAGSDKDAVNYAGQAALHKLALANSKHDASSSLSAEQQHMAHALIAAGADLNLKEKGKTLTPLHCAAQNNNLVMAKILVEAGANKDARNFMELTALDFALYDNHDSVGVYLVEAGADIENKPAAPLSEPMTEEERRAELQRSSIDPPTPALIHAVNRGSASVVEAMIKAGADVNIRNPKDGSTALQAAAGRVAIRDALIKAGANVDAVDDKGAKPDLVKTNSGSTGTATEVDEDALKWDYQQYPPGYFDVIWASPPCTQYSQARTTGGPPDLPHAHAIVHQTLEIFYFLQPDHWLAQGKRSRYTLYRRDYFDNFSDIVGAGAGAFCCIGFCGSAEAAGVFLPTATGSITPASSRPSPRTSLSLKSGRLKRASGNSSSAPLTYSPCAAQRAVPPGATDAPRRTTAGVVYRAYEDWPLGGGKPGPHAFCSPVGECEEDEMHALGLCPVNQQAAGDGPGAFSHVVCETHGRSGKGNQGGEVPPEADMSAAEKRKRNEVASGS